MVARHHFTSGPLALQLLVLVAASLAIFLPLWSFLLQKELDPLFSVASALSASTLRLALPSLLSLSRLLLLPHPTLVSPLAAVLVPRPSTPRASSVLPPAAHWSAAVTRTRPTSPLALPTGVAPWPPPPSAEPQGTPTGSFGPMNSLLVLAAWVMMVTSIRVSALARSIPPRPQCSAHHSRASTVTDRASPGTAHQAAPTSSTLGLQRLEGQEAARSTCRCSAVPAPSDRRTAAMCYIG